METYNLGAFEVHRVVLEQVISQLCSSIINLHELPNNSTLDVNSWLGESCTDLSFKGSYRKTMNQSFCSAIIVIYKNLSPLTHFYTFASIK